MFKTLEQRANSLLAGSTNPPVGAREVTDVLKEINGYKLRGKPSKKVRKEFADKMISRLLEKCNTSEEFYNRSVHLSNLVHMYGFSTDMRTDFTQRFYVNHPIRMTFQSLKDGSTDREIKTFEQKFEEEKKRSFEELDYMLDGQKFFEY